nr:hypothetical protein [Tanacetum cinerariifolium]
RQAHLVDTDIESDPEEASSEAEESQPLVSIVPPMSEEFEASEPSARIAEAAALSPSSFHKRYRSSYETPSPLSSQTLPIRKRYRGTSELILDTKTEEESLDSNAEGEGLENKGPSLDDKDHGLEDEGPDPEDGMVYTDILTYLPQVAPIQTPPSPEWSFSSLSVSPSSLIVPSPIALILATPAATISIDEDQFLEVGARLELHGSILYDHTQRLDALPPTLFKGYNMDLRELYTRSGAVRDEIFSQRYRFRSLEREQERATMTFSAIWRPILALEAWEGQTNA